MVGLWWGLVMKFGLSSTNPDNKYCPTVQNQVGKPESRVCKHYFLTKRGE